MIRRLSFILGIILALILISGVSVFSQEPTATNTEAEPETQWLWGEVSSVDVQKKEILLKYLDYETDQEKEITIAVDEKTTFENAKSLEDIEPQDDLSIDYTVTSDGKNIAKNISLEKPETEEALPAPQEPAPQESAPGNIPQQ